MEKTDIALLKKSAKEIQDKKSNCMERHCALEIYLVIKWIRKLLTKILTPVNSALSFNAINKYKIDNPIVDQKCYICDIKVSEKNKINKDMIKSISEVEYIKTYSNIGLFEMTEEKYLEKCVLAVKNMNLLSGSITYFEKK